MESVPDEPIQAVQDSKVPDEMLQKLHRANQRFHELKQQMDTVAGDAEYGHQQRLDLLQEQLRVAERDVEQVTIEIHGSLKPPLQEPSH